MRDRRYFFKYASMIYRISNRYYDQKLAPYGIGSGQQFFLLRIAENDGITMFDLAGLGHFDKGTVTKAIQKLEERGYLRIEPDAGDRRVRRLFITEQGRKAAEAVYILRDQWNDVLIRGLTPDQQELAVQALRSMSDNAYRYMGDLDNEEPVLEARSFKGIVK